jgi:hypothetical protein
MKPRSLPGFSPFGHASAARLRLALRIGRTLLPGLAVADAERLHMLLPALRQVGIERAADAADPSAGRARMHVAIGDREL